MSEKTKQASSAISLSLLLIGLIAGIGVILLIGMLALQISANSNTVSNATPSNFTGITEIEPAQEIPDFMLINQEGKQTSLSELRGKTTLIFFGFTHCPDVCPTTLSDYNRLYEVLNGDQINFVFISVDGERDTPDIMKQRIEMSRVPFVIGLTGSRESVLNAGAPFNLVAEPGPKDSAGNYSVAHTAAIFVLNAEGQWVAKYTYGTPVTTMIEDLQKRL